MNKEVKMKIEDILKIYLDKVKEKMESSDFNTEMVHEDIRTIHHFVEIVKNIDKLTKLNCQDF